MAKQRKTVKVRASGGTGKRLSQNNFVVIVAILICIGLIASTMIGVFSTGMGGGGQRAESLIEQYTKTLEENPDDIRTREQLAIAFYTSGVDLLNKGDSAAAEKQLNLAIENFQKVIQKEPKNKASLGDMATAYFYTGRTDEAIKYAEQALEIDPEFAPARMNLGVYLASKGDYLKAIQELQKIKSGTASYNQAQDLIKTYESAITQQPAQPQTQPPAQSNTPAQGNNPAPEAKPNN